jgi:hypothetical protein
VTDAPIPTGAVTTADLYREIREISANQTKTLVMLDLAAKTDSDHEVRLRAVEAFRYKALGAAAAVSAVVSVLVVYLSNLHAGH